MSIPTLLTQPSRLLRCPPDASDKMNITFTLAEWRTIEKTFNIKLNDILDFLATKRDLSNCAPLPPHSSKNISGMHSDMFPDMFDDGMLKKYILENTIDPWKGTPFEGYVAMAAKQKGEFGERFVSKIFSGRGYTVERAHSATAGYDRLINGLKVEIKFSIAYRNKKNNGVQEDTFILNHVSKAKDWERLLFCGINPKENNIRLLWFTNSDFTNYITSGGSLFNMQQGGKKIKNDDYMCSKIVTLLECDWVHEGLNDW